MSKFAVQQSVWDRGHAMQQVTSHRGPDGTWRAIRRDCTSAACALLATTSSIWCAPAIARQISGTTGLSIDSVRSEINWTLDSGTVAPGGSMSLVSGHTRRPAAEGFLGEDPKGQVVIVSLALGSPALDGHYLYWLETSTVVNAYYFAYPPPPLFAVCRLKIGAPTTSAAWWRAPQPIGWITVTGSQIDAVAGTYYSRSPGIFSCSASWTSPTTPLAPEAGTPCSRT
jgi:hypothetical protein